MEHNALIVETSFDLFNFLNRNLLEYGINTIYALTVSDGLRHFAHEIYHLILIDLQSIHELSKMTLFRALRQTKFVPILALTYQESNETIGTLIDCGVDCCLPGHTAPLLIAKYAFSLVRRYTTYNHYEQPESLELVPFQCGDIYIDPLRRVVQVRTVTVELRPREFALLLYFMKNPHIVLTAQQICERAWGKEESYGRGVGQPISELRKAIEPDPKHPIYIENVYGVGYRFTAYQNEICGIT